VASLAAQHGATNLRVFGSVARGEQGSASDLDLLIDLDEGRSLLDIAGLVVALEDLLGCRVDITREGGLRDPDLRARILAEAVPL
jgi:predicted nucleotidyltransferase